MSSMLPKLAEIAHCLNEDCNQVRVTNCYTVGADGRFFTLRLCGSCLVGANESALIVDSLENSCRPDPDADNESTLGSQLNLTPVSAVTSNVSDSDSTPFISPSLDFYHQFKIQKILMS